MSKFHIGQRVKYIANDADGMFYPPEGTFGTITSANGNDNGNLLSVEWDNGTLPGSWVCYTYDVIPAEENDNDNDT